jgi:hypothetical protein
MSKLEERLGKIEDKLYDKAFRENKGLGNEVGYYIFDYSPKDELHVRFHIEYLKNKINKASLDFSIVEFDLYEIIISILKKRGFLEKCFEFEKTKGIHHTFEAISKTLRLTSKDSLIVNYILQNTPKNSVVFITGVGKCYPIVRSHTVLNNLHQVLDTVPVVMFYPGEYSGQDLQLFGTLKDDNYYRAFKLV